MIDLSITKNKEWIKNREKLWQPISKDLKGNLRKDELEKVHHYFMTGYLRPGEKITDTAAFGWFPLQCPDAWDYLFQYVVKDKKYFEYLFYYSFDDLSHRALNAEEELAMWDYFAGNIFNPIVTSKIPVGERGEIISVEVNKGIVASRFGLFFNTWATGQYQSAAPKLKERINYYLSMFDYLTDADFEEKDSDGDPASEVGGCIELGFRRICSPKFGQHRPLSTVELKIRQDFFTELRFKIDETPMPPAMKQLWEETKVKQGVL